MKKILVLSKYLQVLGPVSLLSLLYQRFILRSQLLKISVKSLKHKIFIRNQPADFAVFTQVFIHKEYDVPLPHRVKTIIDAGANIGLAALYFKSRYSQAAIICIEPEKENFEMLLKNTEPYKNITCLNAGVWNKNGFLKVVDKGYGSLGFQVTECANGEKGIPAITIKSVMQDWGKQQVDIVKLDIEGSEEEVILDDESNWVAHVQTIFVEIHDNLKPGLTKKIQCKLQPHFSSMQHGEYQVFSSKNAK